MTHAAELTILMVSGPHDEFLVRDNIALIRRMNPQANYGLYVVDNGAVVSAEAGISAEIGAPVLLGSTVSETILPVCRGSYQHAAALNQFLHHMPAPTPYVLVLDPDFYVIRHDWIAEILKHMREHKISIFGSVWHPRWFRKYRYFPSVHFMCIDTAKIPPSALDFTPDSMRTADVKFKKDKTKAHDTGKTKGSKRTARLKKKWRQLVGILKAIGARALIGGASDTGHLLYKKYYRDPNLHTALLQPVLERQFLPDAWFDRLNSKLDKILPDRFCYLPKRKGYFTFDGFKAHGLPHLAGLQWEEFMWQERPFAFHLRRQNKKNRDKSDDQELLKQAFADIEKAQQKQAKAA